MFSNDKKRLPPSQRVIDKILRWGIDHPGITPMTPHLCLENYVLSIDGEVDNPVRLM